MVDNDGAEKKTVGRRIDIQEQIDNILFARNFASSCMMMFRVVLIDCLGETVCQSLEKWEPMKERNPKRSIFAHTVDDE